MTLRAEVVAVLRDSPVDRIKFNIGNITISKTEFEKVAKAIEKDDIAVVTGSSGPKLGASYTSWKTRRIKDGEKKMIGKITLGKGDVTKTPLGKAAIYHESTHALMDVSNHKIPMIDEEVIAYIADVMYLSALPYENFTGTKQVMAIFNAANALIKSKKLLLKPSTVLKWSDCDELRLAIKAHPAYR
ncbi:MAG: hypothetical protein KTR32_36140 [Granulosicoccus sp.]|nr:hypothetical protein [Granulosicoccus sp.]